MPLGILFWVLFVLWVVLSFFSIPALYLNLILVALLFLLGWKSFGFIVSGT